jgi:hypothetical protein
VAVGVIEPVGVEVEGVIVDVCEGVGVSKVPVIVGVIDGVTVLVGVSVGVAVGGNAAPSNLNLAMVVKGLSG